MSHQQENRQETNTRTAQEVDTTHDARPTVTVGARVSVRDLIDRLEYDALNALRSIRDAADAFNTSERDSAKKAVRNFINDTSVPAGLRHYATTVYATLRSVEQFRARARVNHDPLDVATWTIAELADETASLTAELIAARATANEWDDASSRNAARRLDELHAQLEPLLSEHARRRRRADGAPHVRTASPLAPRNRGGVHCGTCGEHHCGDVAVRAGA
ncbi:MAG: hypothetical protein ACYDCK_15270 [Thermoplasmatota archaeon]